MRLLVVKDKDGMISGHLSARIVWDGERFFSDLGNYANVDLNNIVEWDYLDNI